MSPPSLQVQRLQDSATLEVDFHHVQLYNANLAEEIRVEHHRVEPALRKVCNDEQ
jgi:hypothetical protein